MMQKVIIVGMLPFGLLGVGCASISPTQVGQTVGSIAGGAISPIGMPLGALVGTLAGLVVEQHLDKAREHKEYTELSKQLQQTPASAPQATRDQPSGEPTRVWVDERIEQGRLIPGHFELRRI